MTEILFIGWIFLLLYIAFSCYRLPVNEGVAVENVVALNPDILNEHLQDNFQPVGKIYLEKLKK